MLNVNHVCKFSTPAVKPTVPYISECTGSYGYFEYECRVDKLFKLLYGNSYIMGVTRPFKVYRSDWYWYAG